MANRRKRGRQAPPAMAVPRAAAAKPIPRPKVAPAPVRPRPARPVPAGPIGREPFLGAAAVALIAFAVYCLTVQHSLPSGDSGELIASAYTLGIAHPPGYPLYMLLGYVFSHLPVASPATWMNVMSAILDALTVGIVYLIVHRLVSRGGISPDRRRLAHVAAATGSLLLAFSTVFWAYSVVAEVFALNNFFAALLLLLGIEWCRSPERTRLLWALAFVLGLALCNQQTIVLFVPALVILVVRGWSRVAVTPERPLGIASRDVAIGIGAFVAGLLPLVYLPAAAAGNPAMNWGNPDTFGRFWTLLTRQNYGTGTLITGGKRGSLVHNMAMLFSNLTTGFVFAGIVLALAGLVWAWQGQRAEGAALFTAFLVAGPIFQLYTDTAYPDELTKGIIARFYILPSIPVAIVAGLGAWWVLERVASLRLARPVAAAAVAAAGCIAVPFAAAAAHFSAEDQSGNRVAANYARDILGPLPPNTLLLTRGDPNLTTIVYLQKVAHFRPDVIALDTELLKLPNYVSQAVDEHPGLLVPFTQYDGGATTSLNTFVSDNLGKRPVYYIGKQEEKSFAKPFDQVYEGLTTQLLPKGTAPDKYAALAKAPDTYAALHYPAKTYPRSTWEGADISQNYAYAAFYLGFALQTPKDTTHTALIEQMYRTAIRLYPGLTQAYKNLGLVLYQHGGDPKEAISAWETYLRLAPNDPQNGQIRQGITELRTREK